MPDLPNNLDLAVAITTQDNMRTIETTLRSVEGLARRVVVVDSGSTDGTIELCREHGAEVIHHDWEGVTRQKQFAMEQCGDTEWILVLDSDEAPDAELAESIRQIIEDNNSDFAGWAINRKIWFLGGWLNHTFQPEWRLRLVRHDNFKVVGIGADGRGGHDRVVVEGRVGRLRGFCRHDTWADLEAMWMRYLALAKRAGEHEQRGGTIGNILVSPAAAFVKQFLLKRGFLDGKRGLIAAAGAAGGTLLKHVFIARRRAGLGEAG